MPYAYLAFEGEQHGFRRAETIRRAQEAELSFYGRVLGFNLGGAWTDGTGMTENGICLDGRLSKIGGIAYTTEDLALIMALRLAVLFCRNRGDIQVPAMQGRFSGTKFHLVLSEQGWLAQNPLTDTALQEEVRQWKELGVSMEVVED